MGNSSELAYATNLFYIGSDSKWNKNRDTTSTRIPGNEISNF